LDKIRYESLTSEGVLGEKTELEIRIKPDPENHLLHIIDTGVGMTSEDLIRNLGTIAKSGTKGTLTLPLSLSLPHPYLLTHCCCCCCITEFLEKVDQTNADSFIGQFGVGFYSSFLVADEVIVVSKNNNDDQHIWRSTLGSGTAFSLAKDPRGNTLGRGTQITLVLKDDASEYLEPKRLRELVHKYSEFINFPIYLYESHIEERQVPVEKDDDEEEAAAATTDDDKKAATGEDDEDEDEASSSEDEDNEEDEEEFEVIEETVWEWVLLNDTAPLWTRDPKDVSDDEYIKFYKAISKDIEAPIAWTHFKAEGDLEFRAILYVPSDPPSNAFETGKNAPRGVKLYVRRVFITDNFDMLIPKYLSFVKGVVDSNSLQLNVSREILQQDKSLKQMEKKLVRKIIAMIQELAEDKTKYEGFYDVCIRSHTPLPPHSNLVFLLTLSRSLWS